MDFRKMASLLLLLLLGLCNAHPSNDHDADNESSGDGSDSEDMTATILRMNNGSPDLLLEGDLVISRVRNAMKCHHDLNSCLWPKSANGNVEIPFLMSNKYDKTEKIKILKAIKDLESKTCIRFIPRKNQTAYISIEPRYGCSSSLGYIGDKQVVSLQRAGCVRNGIIQHELLHALGFNHEQTRSDRDKHVKIIWANLDKYYWINFRKQDTNNLNTPYDYSSVMHYGRRAFGKFGAVSIIPIPDPSVTIGQKEGVSNIDILRINKLYNCCSYI
ncbi:low choriolytic enzyme-like [Brachionichthys hirsutus]|uniref:low choriolytic enzyme-like n=1 Tax=Brachionichthys hirsutus TaxID=412623 RepID=UPI0036052679